MCILPMKATESYILGVGGFAFMEKPQTMKAIIYFLLSKFITAAQ